MSKLKARKKATTTPVAATLKKAIRTAHQKVTEPWRATVGRDCTFYYEGGHGDRYWSGGWHYGFIREVPIKGQHKGWMRIELPTDLIGKDDQGKYYVKPHEKAWVSQWNVNEPGDFQYHGPKLEEIVQARTNEKASQVREALKNPRAAKPKSVTRVSGKSRANRVHNRGVLCEDVPTGRGHKVKSQG
jgi:hypothetical protein